MKCAYNFIFLIYTAVHVWFCPILLFCFSTRKQNIDSHDALFMLSEFKRPWFPFYKKTFRKRIVLP